MFSLWKANDQKKVDCWSYLKEFESEGKTQDRTQRFATSHAGKGQSCQGT